MPDSLVQHCEQVARFSEGRASARPKIPNAGRVRDVQKHVPPNLRLGVAGEMDFHALRQKTLASALASPRESGPSAFRAHASAKTVLLFAGALRALKCPFHTVGC